MQAPELARPVSRCGRSAISPACAWWTEAVIGAALRNQGVVMDGKKLRRLMRKHELQPQQRRRYVVTPDSDHAGPIYADLFKDCAAQW